MHSLTRHSRQISLHPHFLDFFALSILLFFLFVSEGSIPQNHWLPQIDKLTCISSCIRQIMFKSLIIERNYVLLALLLCLWGNTWKSRLRMPPFQSWITSNHSTIAEIRSLIWRKTFHMLAQVLTLVQEGPQIHEESLFFLVLWRANVEECYSAGYYKPR